MKPLALTVASGAFCLCGLSQEVTLSIAPAVHVTWPSTTNKAYQVETSTNLPGNWARTGELIEGTGGEVGAYFQTTAASRFFKVQETAASGIMWLEGVWQGDTYQASSNSVPFTTQISVTNSSRAFGANHFNSLFACGSNLELLSYSDTQARFYSSIQSGPCLDGTIVVTRVNPTNVVYNWYHPDGPTVASSFGVLSKR
jgi:hypothetical protein